jgi:putative membrane protein
VRHLLNIVRGFLMGSADVVPGVSGGTVALVLGIYERLVHNIRTVAGSMGALVRGRPGEAGRRIAQVDWSFLLPLLLGIGIAIVSLAALLERLLEDEPQAVAGAFFGLVLGSIPVAWRLVRRWDPMRWIIMAGVAATAFVFLGLRSGEVSDPVLWMFFGAGLIAIIAMILPGISGSFILLMIGMYEAVLAAVNDRSFSRLAVFALAAVVGLAAFSTLLDRLLRDHHDTVMAALIGLMAGSLRVLWPWPDGTDTAALARPTDWGIPLLACVAGFAAVTVIGFVAGTGRRASGGDTGRPQSL